MARKIKKQIWMDDDEAADLKDKAEKARMSEAGFMRMLVRGYAPRPAPDDRFFEAMDLIKDFGDRLEDISAAIRDPDAAMMLEAESKKWHLFQNAIEKRYLVPEKVM